MNQQLLQHFQKLRLHEREALNQSNNGYPRVEGPEVKNKCPYREEEKQIRICQQSRFIRILEHSHEHVELIYMYSGQNIYKVNGSEIMLRSGELLLLNQRAVHGNQAPGEHDIIINFVVKPLFFVKTLDMMGDKESELRKFLLNCLCMRNQTGAHFHFKVSDVLPVQALLESMIWSLVNEVHYQQNENQYTMGLLFLHLFNHADKAHSNSKQDNQILVILQYVEENYANGTLSELAKLLGYDVEWLSTTIKRLTGTTFKQLQRNKRVAQAKILLTTTDLLVKEIAKQVGYCDTSHFHRLFQQQVGCRPKVYRDQNKMNN